MRLAGRCLYAVALVLLAVLPAFAQKEAERKDAAAPFAQGPPGLMRPFDMLREDEDWSFLRDPKLRTDPWDTLKYIRLRDSDAWYLTLGGETRQFYEKYRNEIWGSFGPDDPNGYLLHRYMMYSDFHLGDRVRAFGQINSSLVAFRQGNPRPGIDEDRFDVQQAWVDFNLISKPGAFRHPLTLRVGRQELNYGNGRMVSVREGPNVRLPFDGVRVIANRGPWRVDAFAVRPLDIKPGILDDKWDRGQTFWGVYATDSIPRVGKLDLYYLGLKRKLVFYNQGPGPETRHSVGARFGRPRRELPPLDYDVEGVLQFGSFGPGSIRAWTIGAGGGYTFNRVRFSPRIGANAGVTSGDKDPRDPDLQTFFAPFPDGHYFGQIAQHGPLNIMGVRPSLTLDLLPGLMFNLEYYFFWRQSLEDGLYAVPGFFLRPGNFSRSRFVGWQPQAEIIWILNNHLFFSLHHARYNVGSFLRETPPPGRDVRYYNAWLIYRF
jgi:hypothetical protein